MGRNDDVTGTYNSAAAAASTGTYSSDLSETYTYSELREQEFKSKKHGLGVGDKICLRERDYLITKIISEGTGEAVIYQIKDEQQNTLVLKLYFEFNSAKEEPNRESLGRIKGITDPDILTLHDFGVGIDKYQGKYCFEISDYAEGGDLFAVDNWKAKYTPEFIEKTIIPEIFKGIRKLHSHKIYHCDLKPGNIFYLDRNQTDIVLGDYGSSKAYDLESEKDGRKTSTVKGTEVYLSPEQARGIISEKNDYYSFGMILLHLLYPESLTNDADLCQINKEKLERLIERQYNSIPVIDFASAHQRLNRIIEGLTLINHTNRWGGVEVEKWLKGEEVEVRYRSSAADAIQPVKLGYTTIRTSKDFIDVLENNPDGYDDLIDDPDTYATVKVWLASLRDVPTRKVFDQLVRFYQPIGKEYVKEAVLRFFEPERPVAIDMHPFNFFTSAALRKDVDSFIAKLDEIWKITPLESLRFSLFQLEFSLRQLKESPGQQDVLIVSALADKLYAAFGLTLKPFDSFATEIPLAIDPANETEARRCLMNLFYAFNPERAFRDSNGHAINKLDELGVFFARNESAFADKFLTAEKERFLEKIGKTDLNQLDYISFVFEVFKDKAITNLKLEKLTFDHTRNYQVHYRFHKTLNPLLSSKGINKDFTINSGRSETYKQRRRFMQGFSAVHQDFIDTVTRKHSIMTLTADNRMQVRRKFIRESWKRYLSLYKKEIWIASLLLAILIPISIVIYGITVHKLHVDTLLGITWMDPEAYSVEYAKAKQLAHEQSLRTYRNSLVTQQIRVFGGGRERPPVGRRNYQTQFDTRQTRYIYAEVDFTHPQPKERVDLLLKFRLLNSSSGALISEFTSNSYIDPTWDSSWHTMSFGQDRVRNWAKGNYRVEVLVNDKYAGAQNFTVY